MCRKRWLILLLVVAALALLSAPACAAGPLAVTPISAPPEWVNFYGVNSTLNGAPLPVGAEVVAYAGEKRCGSFVVHTAGFYGVLPCYREQDSQPGALPGDRIRFTINGFDAITRGPDDPIWTSNGDNRHVELEASGVPGGPTATRTVMPTSTSSASPIAPATPTPTIIMPPTPTPIVVPPTPTWPALPTATWQPPLPTPTAPPAYTPQPAANCRELLQDGSFEAGVGWTIDASLRPATRSTAQVHSGGYAMRLGIDSEANASAVSAVRQRIYIPSDAAGASLYFYYFLASDPSPSSDYWQVLLLEPGTGTTVQTLFQNGAGNERRWASMGLDLLPWRGRTLDLYFSMYNDGIGPRSVLYLDDVALQICVGGPPTWTPIPSAWAPTATYAPPTPWPTAAGNCQELLVNGGFEAGAQGWFLGPTKAVPGLVADPRHAGNAAMRLGIVSGGSVNAFSSVRQTVNIPSDAVSADLTYWVYLMSTETVAGGKDHQELVYLGTADNSTIALPWRVWHENTRAWTPLRNDLLAYRGQSLIVYFDVYNDGINGDTAMILDDVSLRVCRNVPPTAIPLAVATLTPTPLQAASGQNQPASLAPTAMARSTPTATVALQGASSGANTLIIAIVAVIVAALIGAALIIFRYQARSQGKGNASSGGGSGRGSAGGGGTGGAWPAGPTQGAPRASAPQSMPFNPGATPSVRGEKSPPEDDLDQT